MQDVLEDGDPEGFHSGKINKKISYFNCINIFALVPECGALYIIQLVSYHNKQAFNTLSNNRSLHTAANQWGSCNTKHFMDWELVTSVVTFVVLCCSVASPVILPRGLAGNKAAVLLWGCCAWLLTSHTMQHKGGSYRQMVISRLHREPPSG